MNRYSVHRMDAVPPWRINSESELSFNAGGNAKVQEIVEAAATGSKSFDDIMAEWTQKWNDAQDYLEIDAN